MWIKKYKYALHAYNICKVQVLQITRFRKEQDLLVKITVVVSKQVRCVCVYYNNTLIAL